MESGRPFPWRDHLQVLAESIETLCTVETTVIGPGRGIVRPLYESAVRAQGGSPVLAAAQFLVSALKPDDLVLLSTGIVIPTFMPYGETDGPPGIAALAWALASGLGVTPLVLCESETHPPLRATCAALGLPIRPLDQARKMPVAVALDEFSCDDMEAPAAAARLVQQLQPAAIIVSEKIGVNRLGIPHTSTGKRLEGKRARLDVLVDHARTRGVKAICIGDGGNEIGFGLITPAVQEHKPYGRTCQCGCGGGLACATHCDHLIMANISNWGCYGLVAMLAGLLNRPDLIPAADVGLEMIRACARAGAVDGATGMQTVSVDGVPGQIEAHILDLLSVIVRMALTERGPRRF